jgi:signal peptidase I
MATKARARRQGSPATSTRRVVWRVVASVLLVALVVVWAVLFRQQGLGGPAAYVEVNTAAMAPIIPKGDLAVMERASSYQTGDIVAYTIHAASPGAQATVVGRIVGGDGTTGFVIKGDNVPVADPVRPTSADVVGKFWFHVRQSLRWPITAAVGVLFIVLVIAAWPSRRRRPSAEVPAGPAYHVRAVPGAGSPGPARPAAMSSARVAPAADVAPTAVPVVPGTSAATADTSGEQATASASEADGSYWTKSPRQVRGPAHAKRRFRRRKGARPKA